MPDTHECIKEKEFGTIFTTLNFMSQTLENIKDNDLKHIYEVLDEVRDKLGNRRPTYTITFVLSTCSALITGLVILLLKK